MEAVKAVLERIISSMDSEGHWALPLSSLADLLSISELELYGELYRKMHLAREVHSLTDVVFTAENVGELVGTLELFFDCDVERLFTRQGLFLPHALRVDLQERLIRRFTTDFIIHTVDVDSFDAMLRVARKADRAIGLYLDEYFPVEPAIRSCAYEFARDSGFPAVMEATAAHYLSTLFRRHILDRETLLGSLVKLLKGRARDTGYAPAGKRAAGNGTAGEEPGIAEDRHVLQARKLLGVEDGEITRARIRERYKALIRRYHPDINPDGLEMSKRINNSYALLLARCAD